MDELKNVDISIVIPFYNDIENFARLCISLQDYANCSDIQIIIVDDCSAQEQSSALAEQSVLLGWQNLQVIHCGTNGGASKARRIGIEVSKGEYIAFLDSDDGWAKNKLYAQLSCMKKHDAAISGNPCVQIEREAFDVHRAEPLMNYNAVPFSATQALFSNQFSTPTVMLKATVAKENPFDDNLRYSEDADCWRRILLNHKGVLLQGANAFMFKHAFVSHQGSLSSNTWQMSKGQFQSLTKILSFPGISIKYRLIVVLALIWSMIKAVRREILKRLK